MSKLVAAIVLLLIAAGCRKDPSGELTRLSDEFVHTSLSFSPALATSVGLHEYQKQHLDEMLDDLTPSSLDRQRRFYIEFQDRLGRLKTDRLTAEDQADLAILRDQIQLSLLELNEIASPLHNPTVYVETLGNALFTPYVLEYAPQRTRAQHIIARLQKTPLFLDQARTNLASSPDIWLQVAAEEGEGNIQLVEKTIRAWVPPELSDTYARAAGPALDAMRKFQIFLKDTMPGRGVWDWRLGQARYVRKFRFALSSGIEADSALDMAEREMMQVRARMLELALPLHRQLAPKHGDHSEVHDEEQRKNQLIGEALSHIAERRSTPESYMDDARKDLEEARVFAAQRRLLTLPQSSNLQVIPTPEFMRGIYSVGGFNPAPALEPQLGAFYWVTPIPPNWPKERAESKLREYNFYKLKLLTIHEAMPGHYVQFEFANSVQPPGRRLLRSVFGNGPYQEGWAQYITQAMLDEGFLNHSPELALTFAKEELRVLANTILDVRLQMLGMTDQDAMDLMQRQTFQEKEEASGKLQRAKLSSAQLPMYFLGWRGWLRVRAEYRKAKGDGFNLAGFHDAALKEGAVPLPLLSGLLK